MVCHSEFDQSQANENPRANQKATGAAEELGRAPVRPLSIQGAYKPSEYANLPVGGEVKELFKMIQR